MTIPSYIVDQLSDLSCELVAEKLGLGVHHHKTLCFIHDDHHPSLAFLGENRERWRCFVCDKGGSAINLVMEYAGIDFVEACLWLCNEFNISINDNNQRIPKKHIQRLLPRRKPKTEVKRPFNKEMAQWILDNSSLTERAVDFLFKQRCLKKEIISRMNVKAIEDPAKLVASICGSFDVEEIKHSGLTTITKDKPYFRFFTPCLLFPYYDQNGELVGLQSRYMGDNKEAPRFQLASQDKTRLYNLTMLNEMKPEDELYISEGITDCLSLLSWGKNAVAIPSATILPKSDLWFLRYYDLHMYPDNDNAGKEAYRALNRYFVNVYSSIRAEKLPEDVKDFSDYYCKIHGK